MNHCRIFEVAIQQRFDADSKQAAQSNHLYRTAQQAAQPLACRKLRGRHNDFVFQNDIRIHLVQVVVKGAQGFPLIREQVVQFL